MTLFLQAPRGMKHERGQRLLQPKLNLRVSQRQVLTPGLVQMVSVLALNKLELKEMINTEMVENPVLEEVEESAVTIEEWAGARRSGNVRPRTWRPRRIAWRRTHSTKWILEATSRITWTRDSGRRRTLRI